MRACRPQTTSPWPGWPSRLLRRSAACWPRSTPCATPRPWPAGCTRTSASARQATCSCRGDQRCLSAEQRLWGRQRCPVLLHAGSCPLLRSCWQRSAEVSCTGCHAQEGRNLFQDFRLEPEARQQEPRPAEVRQAPGADDSRPSLCAASCGALWLYQSTGMPTHAQLELVLRCSIPTCAILARPPAASGVPVLSSFRPALQAFLGGVLDKLQSLLVYTLASPSSSARAQAGHFCGGGFRRA